MEWTDLDKELYKKKEVWEEETSGNHTSSILEYQTEKFRFSNVAQYRAADKLWLGESFE